MNKVFIALLVLVASAAASRSSLRVRRQIFDTIDFNSGFKNARIPARQNSLEPRSGKGSDGNNKYTTGAQTYLPPSPSVSTPGPKYLFSTTTTTPRPTITTSTVSFAPYTGTFATYKTSSYKPYTGTYAPPPSTFKPLSTTSTTRRPVVGYEYTKPSNDFVIEDGYKR